LEVEDLFLRHRGMGLSLRGLDHESKKSYKSWVLEKRKRIEPLSALSKKRLGFWKFIKGRGDLASVDPDHKRIGGLSPGM